MNDGSITWDLMVERLNSDLANTLGNLVNRTIAIGAINILAAQSKIKE